MCSPDNHDRLISILSEELGTLGIRHMQNIHRSILERKIVEVPFEHGDSVYTIRVKTGYINGELVTIKAEYEDLKTVAGLCKLPLKRIARCAENEALKKIFKQ